MREMSTHFLGVRIDTDANSKITMSQLALIDMIIKSLGLDNKSTQHQTPVVSPPLHKHEDKEKVNGIWSYISLIGMLTYLYRNTRSAIKYAVH